MFHQSGARVTNAINSNVEPVLATAASGNWILSRKRELPRLNRFDLSRQLSLVQTCAAARQCRRTWIIVCLLKQHVANLLSSVFFSQHRPKALLTLRRSAIDSSERQAEELRLQNNFESNVITRTKTFARKVQTAFGQGPRPPIGGALLVS